MKKLLCSALLGIGMLFALGGTNAQAAEGTNVPLTADYFSKEDILEAVKAFDTDKDGTLSPKEIAAVTSLSIPSGGFDFSQIQYFTNLKELQLGSEEVSVQFREPLDCTMFKNLERLTFYQYFSNIDVNASGLQHLKEVTIKTVEPDWESEAVHYIDLRDTPALETLHVYCSGGVKVDEQTAIKDLSLLGSGINQPLSAFPQLEKLETNAFPNKYTDVTFDLTVCNNLKELIYTNEIPEELLLPASLEKIFIQNFHLKTIDVSKLTHLKSLNLEETFYSPMPDLSNNQELVSVTVDCNEVPAKLDFRRQKKLEVLDICLLNVDNKHPMNETPTIDLGENKKLKTLRIGGFPAQTLDLSKNTALTELEVYRNNNLKNLNISKNTALTRLTLRGISLKSLDVSKHKQLKYLYLSSLPLTQLNLKNNTKLSYLRAEKTNLTTLDLTKHKNLKKIIVRGNKLKALNLGSKPKLTALYCQSNNIKTLNLSGANSKLLKKIQCDKGVKVTGYKGLISHKKYLGF